MATVALTATVTDAAKRIAMAVVLFGAGGLPAPKGRASRVAWTPSSLAAECGLPVSTVLAALPQLAAFALTTNGVSSPIFMVPLMPPALGSWVAITNATNTSPIVVTTASPHGLTDGAVVTVFGVVGNTGANGTWTISVISSTQLTLNTSNGTGLYVAGFGLLGAGTPQAGSAGWVLIAADHVTTFGACGPADVAIDPAAAAAFSADKTLLKALADLCGFQAL